MFRHLWFSLLHSYHQKRGEHRGGLRIVAPDGSAIRADDEAPARWYAGQGVGAGVALAEAA